MTIFALASVRQNKANFRDRLRRDGWEIRRRGRITRCVALRQIGAHKAPAGSVKEVLSGEDAS